MRLYHYFEKEIGPFRSISDLSDEEETLVFSDSDDEDEDFLWVDV